MIGWMMRRLPPGSFGWLTLHELRLALAARRARAWSTIVMLVLLLGWTALGGLIAYGLWDEPITADATAYVVVAAAAIAVFSFMFTQALLASQRTLYESGDLDLLLSAPLDPRRVVAAKLMGVVAAIALTFALLILPLTLPMAVLGHPGLLGIPALLLALALVAACLGLAVTLLLARVAGPRAARTVGQVVAALAGGAFFLTTQLMNQPGEHNSRWEAFFIHLQESGFAGGGVGALPGRAAFGDPLAILLLLGAAVLLFVATTAAMQNWFLAGYRAGGMRLSPRRTARGRTDRHFHRSLSGAVFAKEWRLLARDPALAFQILLRLVYLAPFFLIVMRHTEGTVFGPSLAFASVMIAGQVVGSLAWLGVSAEDSPDLLKVAPVDKEEVDTAKLGAAMAMSAPLIVLLPIAIAFETIPGAIIALVMTIGAGWATGWLEVAHAKPAPRSTFQRRQSGSVLRGVFELLISMILGVVAGALVYLAEMFL